MDAHRDRTPPPERVNPERADEIRRDIEGIRRRIAGAIDALTYKADVPSRLADVLGSAASSFTARLLDHLPGESPDGLVRSEEHAATPSSDDAATPSAMDGRPGL